MRRLTRVTACVAAAVLIAGGVSQPGYAAPSTHTATSGVTAATGGGRWTGVLRSFVSGGKKTHKPVAAKATTFSWKPSHGRTTPSVPVDPHARRGAELTTKRTANESFYRLSDGRVQEVVSAEPVHYRGSNGAWQAISTAVAPVLHGRFSLGAESNSFRTYFSSSASSLLRVEQGAGFVELGADAARDGAPKVTGNTVTYPGALDGADLQYQVGGGGLKENIVLAGAPAAGPAYPFTLRIGGFTPRQRPDGSIALYGAETSRAAFVIPEPYMSDSHVEASSPYGVAYSTKVGQSMRWDAASGTLHLTLRPDPAWLHDSARQYPVTIDPTILVAPTPSQAANVMILSDGATTNYTTSWRMAVGTTTTGIARSLIRFPMPSVPSGTTISSASLRLYYDQDHTTDSNNVTLEAHQATAAWDPTTATWQNASGITGVLAGSTTKQANVTSVWNTYPVTSTVQSWINGSPNYGFVIKAQNESTLGQGGPRYESSTYAYEGETANYPQLVITYGVPGVAVNAPTVIHSTGAELSWPAYTNTTGNPANNIVEYQVHRSVFQSFTPSASSEVAPVGSGALSFTDTTAEPTPTSSTDLYGNVYYYMVVVKTAGGALIPGPTEIVRLPKAGLTEVIMRKGAATTLSSTQPNAVLNTLLDSGLQKPEIEVGNNSTTYGKARSVFTFGSLPATIPQTAVVKDAHLKVWQEVTTTGTSGAVYELHGLTTSFNPAQATWSNAASGTAWTTAGGDYSSTVASTVSGLTNDPNRRTFDATAIVQGWAKTPSANHGLELKLANEASTAPQERTVFAGTNTAEPLLSPTLVVTYLDPTSANTYYAPVTPEKMVPGTTYTVPVTVNNTTASTWSAGTEALTYHWTLPDGTDVTGSGNQLTTALPASLAPGAAATVNARVTPPTPGDTNDKGAYTLSWDMKNTSTGAYVSTTQGGVGSLAQAVGVEPSGSNQIGLESFYQYATTATGSGSALYSNESSGNTVWNYNAFSNPSRGFSTFARMSYNSLDTTDTTAGFGWSVQLSTPTRLGTPLDFHPNPHPTEVSFTDGDGTGHVFTWNATAATWTAPAGVHLYLQQLADCGPQVTNARAWVMTRPDRTQFFYDCAGYPTAVVDKNGNEADFTYTARNSQNKPTEFLTYVTDPSGRKTLSVSYFAKGDSYQYVDGAGAVVSGTNLTDPQIIDHVKSITDVSGREIDFLYTTNGLLARMVDGAGSGAAKTFSFGYDATQGMKNVKLVQVTDPRGDATRISYYDPVTDPKFHWWTQRVTDRLGGTRSLSYVEPGTVTGAAVQTTVTDARNHATVYQLDGAGRLIQTTNALGQKMTIGWDAQNDVTSIAEDNGARTTWTYDPATGYPLTKKDALADKNNTTAETYTYQTSLSGHIADVTDKTTAGGRHWHFTYDTKGNLATVQEPNGTQAGSGYVTTYAYDALGQLQTLTDANNHTTRYSGYDSSGYPGITTDPLGNQTTVVYGSRGEVTSTTDPLGHTSTQNFDVFLRPMDSRVPKDQAAAVYLTTPAPVYDANDNVTQRTGPNGAMATATYDADDRVTATTLPQDTATTPVRRTTYTYDGVGNRLTVTSADGNVSGAAAGSYTTTTGYDAVDQPITVTDAAGHIVTTGYDDVGDPVTSTDPLGHTTVTAYDLDHRPTTVTDAAGYASTTAYDLDGLKTSSTDRNGNTTLFGYDQDGRLIQQKTPHTSAGGTITYDTTQYTYDQVGNRTAVISPRGVASGVPNAFTARTSYDADNRKSADFGAYDPNDATYHTAPETDYTYDAAGRLVTVTAPPSGGSTVRPVTANTYWDNGWTRSSTDPWSITTSYDYNAIGKQTSRTITSAGGSSSRSQSWDFYPDGKLRSRTDTGVPVGLQVELVDNSDAQNTATTGTWNTATGTGTQGYDYRTHAAATGTDTFTWNLSIPQDGTYQVYVRYPAVTGAATTAQYTVAYNGGSATDTVDQSHNGGTWVLVGSYAFTQANTGQKISLAQNATGTVAADAVKVVRDNSGDTQPKPEAFSYTYDPDGNLADLSDASPQARYDDYTLQYDGLGQLTQMQEKAAGTVKHTTAFSYDAAGNAVSESHDGATATYTFDVRDALSQVVNKESGSDPNPKTTRYTYTPDGNIATETKGNGNVVTTTYTLDNSVATSVEKTSTGTVVAQHTYTYDPNGNQTRDVSVVQNADNNASTLNRTATNTFTPRDQVATATHSDGNDDQSYTYDLAGNTTAQTVGGTATTNVYDRNRLLTATTGGVTARYNYDPFGRTDSVTAAGTVQQRYTYDGFDQIASETKDTGSGLVTTRYTYDPFDRTVSQTDNADTGSAKTTVFEYLATSKAMVSESIGGNLSKSYQYAPTGERLDQIVHNSDGTETPTFYSYNTHTDVQAITDVNGNTKSTYGYTAYGKDDTSQDSGVDKGTGSGATGGTSTDPYNVYRFNSNRIDASTGNYDMGFREYDPSTNRFLSRDMYNGAFADTAMSTDPYTGNRYTFASGNPLSNVELDGHFDVGSAWNTLVKDVESVVEPIVEGGAEEGAAADATGPVGLALYVAYKIIFTPSPTASAGVESPIGDKPDYDKGLFVTPDRKVEWTPVDTTSPRDREDCTKGQNFVFYSPLDDKGRATGVMACLSPGGFNYTNDKGEVVGNPDSQISGSRTVWPSTAPGFAESFPKGMRKGMQRGHLLGTQLGGVGDDLRNLVPLYPKANSPTMRDYENYVAGVIAAGNTVFYTSKPVYNGDNPIPTGVTLQAWTSSGEQILGVTVLNRQY